MRPWADLTPTHTDWRHEANLHNARREQRRQHEWKQKRTVQGVDFWRGGGIILRHKGVDERAAVCICLSLASRGPRCIPHARLTVIGFHFNFCSVWSTTRLCTRKDGLCLKIITTTHTHTYTDLHTHKHTHRYMFVYAVLFHTRINVTI